MSRSRLLRTALRTLHLIAFGAYYGGHVFAVDSAKLLPAHIATGTVFLLFEVWRAPVFLIQVRGLATYANVSLLIASYWFWADRALLTAVEVIGSLVSHPPSSIRYYSPFADGVVDTGKG
jgi:hypothetical protein